MNSPKNNQDPPPPPKPLRGHDTCWTDNDPDGGYYDTRIRL